MTISEIQKCWYDLCETYTRDTALIDRSWHEILTAYSSKSRHYHGLGHIGFMLQMAIQYKHEITTYNTLLFSIFYHDIIYKTTRKDNEEKSAELAVQRLDQLGIPENEIAQCYDQIVATRLHEMSSDSDTNYLLDFNLAILGAQLEIYQLYSENTRKEYAVFPDFIYNRGCKKVLEHFLEQEHIFKTEVFRTLYEQQAHKNLSLEYKSL